MYNSSIRKWLNVIKQDIEVLEIDYEKLQKDYEKLEEIETKEIRQKCINDVKIIRTHLNIVVEKIKDLIWVK